MILNKGLVICWMLLFSFGSVQHTDCQPNTEPFAYDETTVSDYNGADESNDTQTTESSGSYVDECEENAVGKKTECENTNLTISCQGTNEVVKVSKAFFKPIDNNNLCGKPQGHILAGCKKQNVTSNSSSLCDEKHSCNINVDRETFGDPCTDAFKSYLEITYSCEDQQSASGQIERQICEPVDGHQLQGLSCEPNRMFNVTSALYKALGANNHGYCSNASSQSPPAGIYCKNITVSDSVGEKCNGRNKCRPQVNDGLYGDPCYDVFAYYLEIEYECITRSQKEFPTRHRCGDSTNNICTNGIDIESTLYQMKLEGFSCHEVPFLPLSPKNPSLDDICSASKGMFTCRSMGGNGISNSTDIFTSYLEIWYTCDRNKDEIKYADMEYGKELKIDCNDSELINITNAAHTLKQNHVYACNSSTLNFTAENVQCSVSANITSIVTSNYCNNTESFCIFVNESLFRKPDVNAIKHTLIAEYNCTDAYTDVVCPEINGTQIFWPETPAGQTTASKQRCPVDTASRGRLPFATRQCVINETLRKQQWEPVNLTNCGGKEEPGVDSLSKTPVSIGNAEEVADALANVIEDLVDLAEDVDIVAVQQTVVNIVNVGSSSPVITGNVIRTINCLLNANISASSERDPDVANSSSLILKAFETQISQTLKDYETLNSTKPNIVVQGVTVNENQTETGVEFEIASTNSGFGDSNIEGQIRSISIEVPKDALIGSNDTRVSFVGYKDDTLFRSNMLGNKVEVLGPIISANVLGKNIGNLSQQQQVVIRMKPSQVTEAVLNSSRCVYWDFSLRDGIGDWAEDGCVRVAADSEGIICRCSHLTNFAVLVDFAGQGGEQTEPGALTFALDIISKVGCAVSIVALCITLLIFLLSSRLRMSLQRKILIQFCFAMLFLYLSFLIGIDSQSKGGCLFAGLLLHYFVLSTMFWMVVEARHMYITLVSESDRVGRQFMRKACAFAWGGALIPVLVVLAVKQDEYLANAYCFVAPDYGLYFGLLCPIAVVILHNTITFVFVAKTLMSAKSYALKPDLEADATDTTDAKEVAQRLLNAFAVSVILGLTWAFGFLAIEEARGAFQLLFCIFNSFQGVLIFILFCYAQKDVRKLVFDKCCADAVPHPKPKKAKEAIDAAGNPITPGPATLMSSSTRVTGESYSEDNDTLVTKVDDATLLVTTTESAQENDHEEVELRTTSADVGKPDPKESVGKDDEALIPNSTATEETNISLGSETNSSAQWIVKG